MSEAITIAAVFCIYFLPGLIGLVRGHRNGNAITALNLLAGWTGVGWVVALVWSLTDNVATGDRPANRVRQHNAEYMARIDEENRG